MKIKMNIRNKFLIPTLMLIVIGMGVSTAVSYVMSKQALSAALLDNIEQRTASTVVILQSWLKDRQLDLSSWKNEEVYAKALKDSFVGKAARISAIEKFTRLRAEYGYYEDITLINGDGLVVASSTEKIIGKLNVKDRAYFKSAIAGQTYISDVATSRNTGNPVFFIAVPIVVKDKVEGVLIGVVNIESFSKLFIDPIKVGKSGYAFVFNKLGLVVAHPDKTKIMKTDLNDFEFGKEIIKRKIGLIDYVFEGERCRAAFRNLEEVDWTIVVKVPESEILAR